MKNKKLPSDIFNSAIIYFNMAEKPVSNMENYYNGQIIFMVNNRF